MFASSSQTAAALLASYPSVNYAIQRNDYTPLVCVEEQAKVQLLCKHMCFIYNNGVLQYCRGKLTNNSFECLPFNITTIVISYHNIICDILQAFKLTHNCHHFCTLQNEK